MALNTPSPTTTHHRSPNCIPPLCRWQRRLLRPLCHSDTTNNYSHPPLTHLCNSWPAHPEWATPTHPSRLYLLPLPLAPHPTGTLPTPLPHIPPISTSHPRFDASTPTQTHSETLHDLPTATSYCKHNNLLCLPPAMQLTLPSLATLPSHQYSSPQPSTHPPLQPNVPPPPPTQAAPTTHTQTPVNMCLWQTPRSLWRSLVYLL